MIKSESRAPGRRRWISPLAWFAAALAVCIASRGFYYWLGVRFTSNTVEYFAQLLPPALLRDRLLESIWYLHMQPPIYNLLTGIALKVAPTNYGPFLWKSFVVIGFVTYLSLLGILRRLGFSPFWAFTLATAYYCSPAFIVYENWYFYPHICEMFLAMAGYFLLRAGARAGWALAAAFAALGGLVLTRSLIHPAFLIVGMAALLPFRWAGGRRRFAVIAAVASLPVILWVARNAVMFGFIGTSSWSGNNFFRAIISVTPAPEAAKLIADGMITPISQMWVFSDGADYRRYLDQQGRVAAADWGVPAMDQTDKPGAPANPVNYNHWSYLYTSPEYMKNALAILKLHPAIHLRVLKITIPRYFDPVTHDNFLGYNRPQVHVVDDALQGFEESLPGRALLALAILICIGKAFQRTTPAPVRMALAFFLGTLLWSLIVGNIAEMGENNRFRYEVYVVYFVCLAYGTREWCLFLWRRFAREVFNQGRQAAELPASN